MAAQLLLCALGQTAEPSAYDTAAASAYASCGGFNVTSSPQLTVTQLTPTSATVTSASAGTTFWLADGAGTGAPSPTRVRACRPPRPAPFCVSFAAQCWL
eukprot:6749404-Prymnesium_polylepis.1